MNNETSKAVSAERSGVEVLTIGHHGEGMQVVPYADYATLSAERDQLSARVAQLEEALQFARELLRDKFGHANAPYDAEATHVLSMLDVCFKEQQTSELQPDKARAALRGAP